MPDAASRSAVDSFGQSRSFVNAESTRNDAIAQTSTSFDETINGFATTSPPRQVVDQPPGPLSARTMHQKHRVCREFFVFGRQHSLASSSLFTAVPLIVLYCQPQIPGLIERLYPAPLPLSDKTICLPADPVLPLSILFLPPASHRHISLLPHLLAIKCA